MLKKFFMLTFAMMMLLTVPACATTFQQPEKIGSVGTSGYGVNIDGATKIDADSDNRGYTKGIAIFGDKLYLHFDAATASDFNKGSYFGSSDANNTVQYYVFEGLTKISRLPNDSGFDMYLLETEYGAGNAVTLIGNVDGKWVKFFDTSDMKKTYGLKGYFTKEIYYSGDTITLLMSSFDQKDSCKIQYRWNSSTKSFDGQKI